MTVQPPLGGSIPYAIIAVWERWPSGLRRRSRKPVSEQSDRGFESHPLRGQSAVSYRPSPVARRTTEHDTGSRSWSSLANGGVRPWRYHRVPATQRRHGQERELTKSTGYHFFFAASTASARIARSIPNSTAFSMSCWACESLPSRAARRLRPRGEGSRESHIGVNKRLTPAQDVAGVSYPPGVGGTPQVPVNSCP